MKMHNVVKGALVACMLLAACSREAQRPGDASGVASDAGAWKKQVTRMIDMEEPEDTVDHHLKVAGQDSTLAELVISAVKSGRLAAYSTMDNKFTTRLTVENLEEMLGSRTDTIVITDPVTGDELTKVVKRDFNTEAVHKYRLLEEWALNPATGKTEIQITGIAPVREVYGDDGTLRGIQAMFWLKYADVRELLAKTEQANPRRNLMGLLWDDYFFSDVNPEAVK